MARQTSGGRSASARKTTASSATAPKRSRRASAEKAPTPDSAERVYSTTNGRQAVIVVHGMGEQRPLGTLKEFVETVFQRDLDLMGDDFRPSGEGEQSYELKRMILPDGSEGNRVWVVPDDTAGSSELRRITTPPTQNGYRTDFFEFYWADIMAGNTWEMVKSWVMGLLLRRVDRVPTRVPVIRAWLLLWVISLALVAAYSGSFAALVDAFSGSETPRYVVQACDDAATSDSACFEIAQQGSGAAATSVWHKLQTLPLALSFWEWVLAAVAVALVAGGVMLLFLRQQRYSEPVKGWVYALWPCCLTVIGLVLAFVPSSLVLDWRIWMALVTAGLTFLANRIIAPYIGDVVRYCRATPDTVGKREAIRTRGLALLDRIHKAGEGKRYDRIVIVAHSLGTIVAYDLVQLYWERYGPTHHTGKGMNAASLKAAKAVDAFVAKAWPGEFSSDPAPGPNEFDRAAFARARGQLQKALNTQYDWRLTDFITLGSPLVHAEFLQFDTRGELNRAFEERGLYSCPPRPDPPKNSMIYDAPVSASRTGSFLHFAAAFGAVKWSNIYDYSPSPLLGDVVSGDLQPGFGPLIDDHKVRMQRELPGVLSRLFTHTLYWKWASAYGGGGDHLPAHISLLRQALNLDRQDM